jgi:hypothetical protein
MIAPCDLQRLSYEMGDRHIPYPNMEEDMEFTKMILVKQKLEEIFLSLRLFDYFCLDP